MALVRKCSSLDWSHKSYVPIGLEAGHSTPNQHEHLFLPDATATFGSTITYLFDGRAALHTPVHSFVTSMSGLLQRGLLVRNTVVNAAACLITGAH